MIKKFGTDKITHGLIGMFILVVCVAASVFLFGVSFLSASGGMVLGTVVAYLVGKWRESRDDVPNTVDIRAIMRGAHFVVSIILLIWSAIWIIKLLF